MIENNLPSAINCTERPYQAALILLAHVLQKPKTWVLAHPETHLNPDQKAHLDAISQPFVRKVNLCLPHR